MLGSLWWMCLLNLTLKTIGTNILDTGSQNLALPCQRFITCTTSVMISMLTDESLPVLAWYFCSFLMLQTVKHGHQQNDTNTIILLTIRGVATGLGGISIYIHLQKSDQVNFSCSKNSVKTIIELIPQ